jgi:tetratricopeptide (TPR) repeat protein
VGQVAQTESLLESLPRGGNDRTRRLAAATEQLIAAVKLQAWRRTQTPEFATEWLSESYYLQARSDLAGALAAARKAVERSPGFGFGWERVAELEFSFGRTSEALRALEKSLALAPRNAQAFALKGFLLSAENRISEARQCFEQAISLDGALANAWLGRGLCRLRRGDSAGGLEDLTVAAALEPQRSLLRSYLGKAYTAVDDYHRASKELKLATNLDPKDPTAWLYSALLKQQQNRVNEAIGDLETSEDLNDNRSVFRSRLLLDEDLAVSSANLASIYRDAGMDDVSVREAARAVTYDYANASAHLFLSDSYNDLRDPTRFNLRYETVWFNELLLANLLAPVGGGRLSQHVSQQEYSSLFQADGLGIANSTLGRSDNKSVTELVSQFGTFGGTSYALDLDYQHNGGVRPNNGLDSIEWYTTVKQQITPQDTLFALVKYEDYHSGDNFQYYYQTNARPNYQYDEYQQPIVVGGWHHEWSPGVHTLLLGGRISTEQDFSDVAGPQASQLMLIQDPTGALSAATALPFNVSEHDQFEIYLAELNQIFEWDRVTLSLGGRWQGGSFQTQAQFSNPPSGFPGWFNDPVAQASLDEGFNRYTGYGYLTVEPLEHLWLTGGAAYDDITYPANFRNPPLSPGEAHTCQLGPKAGLVWSPVSLLTVRGAYTRSLGGVSEDENYRLEQTQVAGFPQTFRSLIPESVVGSVCAPEFETYAVALDLKFPSHTYVGIQAQQLNSDVNQTIGSLVASNGLTPFVPSSTPEQLRYRETSIGGSINQLLGDAVVVGAGSSYNQARLQDSYPKIPFKGYNSTLQADLLETSGYVLLNHPSGFFARVDATWYHQVNSGYTPGLPGDSFVQENLYVGYRFLHRHAELMFGILNLSDQDYHLNPLSTYVELPRERSYVLRLNFIF